MMIDLLLRLATLLLFALFLATACVATVIRCLAHP